MLFVPNNFNNFHTNSSVHQIMKLTLDIRTNFTGLGLSVLLPKGSILFWDNSLSFAISDLKKGLHFRACGAILYYILFVRLTVTFLGKHP